MSYCTPKRIPFETSYSISTISSSFMNAIQNIVSIKNVSEKRFKNVSTEQLFAEYSALFLGFLLRKFSNRGFLFEICDSLLDRLYPMLQNNENQS